MGGIIEKEKYCHRKLQIFLYLEEALMSKSYVFSLERVRGKTNQILKGGSAGKNWEN